MLAIVSEVYSEDVLQLNPSHTKLSVLQNKRVKKGNIGGLQGVVYTTAIGVP